MYAVETAKVMAKCATKCIKQIGDVKSYILIGNNGNVDSIRRIEAEFKNTEIGVRSSQARISDVDYENSFCSIAKILSSLATRSCDLRNSPGKASSVKIYTNPSKILRGTTASVGVIPKEVVDQLQGRSFDTFDKFREAFWIAMGNSKYIDEFESLKKGNIVLMKGGFAPIAIKEQIDGGNIRYVLHHRKPIWDGGEVYNIDNLLIVTPRYHKEVLVPDYHFQRGDYK